MRVALDTNRYVDLCRGLEEMIPGPGLSFHPLAWTPDSQRLLGLARPDTRDPNEGMAYTLSSRSYEKLPIGGDTRHLMPLPDGHHVTVTADERHGIALLDTGSRESRMLLPTDRARYIQTWAISPDEKFLFVNRATEQADIWLATLE
jgi:hypothetical protein